VCVLGTNKVVDGQMPTHSATGQLESRITIPLTVELLEEIVLDLTNADRVLRALSLFRGLLLGPLLKAEVRTFRLSLASKHMHRA